MRSCGAAAFCPCEPALLVYADWRDYLSGRLAGLDAGGVHLCVENVILPTQHSSLSADVRILLLQGFLDIGQLLMRPCQLLCRCLLLGQVLPATVQLLLQVLQASHGT